MMEASPAANPAMAKAAILMRSVRIPDRIAACSFPPTEGGLRQQEGQDHRETDHDPDRVEYAEKGAATQPNERVDPHRNQPPVGDSDGDTLEDEGRRDGREKRMHLERGDDDAVGDPEQEAHAGPQKQPEIGIDIHRKPGRRDRPHGEDRPDRQVETADDDHQRHRRSHDRERCVLVENVEQVARRQKVLRRQAEHDDEQADQDQNRVGLQEMKDLCPGHAASSSLP